MEFLVELSFSLGNLAKLADSSLAYFSGKREKKENLIYVTLVGSAHTSTSHNWIYGWHLFILYMWMHSSLYIWVPSYIENNISCPSDFAVHNTVFHCLKVDLYSLADHWYINYVQYVTTLNCNFHHVRYWNVLFGGNIYISVFSYPIFLKTKIGNIHILCLA